MECDPKFGNTEAVLGKRGLVDKIFTYLAKKGPQPEPALSPDSASSSSVGSRPAIALLSGKQGQLHQHTPSAQGTGAAAD